MYLLKYIMKHFVVLALFVFAKARAMYHATDDILNRLNHLCTVEPILSCTYHDDILVLDINREKDEPIDTLWTFNEHARERITGEIALHVVEDLVHMRPPNRITIIPILNVWGRRRVDNGEHCLRKNEHGVDTNRNYQIEEHHPYPRKGEEYEGEAPMSEKESQLVSSLLQRGVRRYINIHSGEFSMYMPYDSKMVEPPRAAAMKHFLHQLHPLCPECVGGSAAKVSSYKAYGTSVDYAMHLGVPEAYTFEVYGSEHGDCNEMFNPTTIEDFNRVVGMWSEILVTSLHIK